MKSAFSLLLTLLTLHLTPLRATAESGEYTMDLDEVYAVIGGELMRYYEMEGEWELDLVRPISIPTGTDSLRVAQAPSRPASSMLLRVQFLGAGAVLSEANLAFRVQLWRDVWVAQEPLMRGQAVDPFQLSTQRVDTLREGGAVPVEAISGIDFIYYRSIPAGRVLNWRDLVRRPVIQRGQLIEVAAIDRGLSVTMKGLALENGAVGELIRIRNPESRREIAALVVGEGRAEIRF